MSNAPDIYDEVRKVNPSQAPREHRSFSQCLPTFMHGGVHLSRFHYITLGIPAVLCRTVLHGALVADGSVVFGLLLLLEPGLYVLLFPVRVMMRETLYGNPSWPLFTAREQSLEFWKRPVHIATLCKWYLYPVAASSFVVLLVGLGVVMGDAKELSELSHLFGAPFAVLVIAITLSVAWFNEESREDQSRLEAKRQAAQAREHHRLYGPGRFIPQHELQAHYREQNRQENG